jgi:hypothetical protein
METPLEERGVFVSGFARKQAVADRAEHERRTPPPDSAERAERNESSMQSADGQGIEGKGYF